MSKETKCLRQLTELNWSVPPDMQNYKYIGLGFLLRITEAVEAMAENHKELIEERDHYETWFREEVHRRQKLERRISALKGYITKLKKERTQ